jgi:hypothetical protein
VSEDEGECAWCWLPEGAAMTPLMIQILLHYHSVDGPYAEHNPGHRDSIAVRDQTAALLRDEMIVSDKQAAAGFRVTERGSTWVRAICYVPLPIMNWVVPKAKSRRKKAGVK